MARSLRGGLLDRLPPGLLHVRPHVAGALLTSTSFSATFLASSIRTGSKAARRRCGDWMWWSPTLLTMRRSSGPGDQGHRLQHSAPMRGGGSGLPYALDDEFAVGAFQDLHPQSGRSWDVPAGSSCRTPSGTSKVVSRPTLPACGGGQAASGCSGCTARALKRGRKSSTAVAWPMVLDVRQAQFPSGPDSATWPLACMVSGRRWTQFLLNWATARCAPCPSAHPDLKCPHRARHRRAGGVVHGQAEQGEFGSPVLHYQA